MSILLLLLLTLVYGHSLPSNKQNLCPNVVDDTCSKLKRNVKGQSLSESIWSGILNLEQQPGSIGSKIEAKYYQDQLELLTNEKYRKSPYMKDLQELYRSCLTKKKFDLYESPLIEKLFRVCGGDAIFNPNVQIEKDIEQVMADLHRNFGISPVFNIPFGSDLRLDSMLLTEFTRMDQVYRKLYNNGPDQEAFKILDQISKLEYDIEHSPFSYGPTSYTKSQLKKALENRTIDWMKYVELSVMNKEDFVIRLNMDDIDIREKAIEKYGKRTFLGHMFFAALKFAEYELYDISPNEDRQFSQKECLKMVSTAWMPFFAQYFKIHEDKAKAESIERSAEEIRAQMIGMVEDSKRISEETKKAIVEELASTKIFVQYPETLRDEQNVENYMKELKFEECETFFEKMASIWAANFRFASKFYFEESKENSIWWKRSSLNHKLNPILYDTRSHSIVVKKIMQDDIFYDSSKNSFQVLDWYLAQALAYAVAEYNAESRSLKDAKNRQDFHSCMQENMTISFDAQNICTQLALTVFHKRQYESGQSLQEFFDALIWTECGTIDDDSMFVHFQQKRFSLLQKSLANLIEFSKTYQCNRNQTDVCSVL